MKLTKKMVPAICGILVLAAAALCGDATAGKGPAALVSERVHTFEPVPDGTEVVYDFVLRNIGDEVLFIEKLKSG
ncbi:hypothetical protein [Desulfococcus sp.]|uniref:hypothetical protein n=1 Tax=Desulfococcus sp. TaxID=2025834 RepID=UPI0035946633